MTKTRRRIKVLICNRYSLFRDGLKAIFGSNRRIRIAAEAGAGEEAIAAAERVRPDVLLLDVDLPGLSGFATMHRILARDPGIKILIMTLSKSRRGQIARCLESGAAGQIRRTDRLEQLEKAIMAAAGGRSAATGGSHLAVGGRRA